MERSQSLTTATTTTTRARAVPSPDEHPPGSCRRRWISVEAAPDHEDAADPGPWGRVHGAVARRCLRRDHQRLFELPGTVCVRTARASARSDLMDALRLERGGRRQQLRDRRLVRRAGDLRGQRTAPRCDPGLLGRAPIDLEPASDRPDDGDLSHLAAPDSSARGPPRGSACRRGTRTARSASSSRARSHVPRERMRQDARVGRRRAAARQAARDLRVQPSPGDRLALLGDERAHQALECAGQNRTSGERTSKLRGR